MSSVIDAGGRAKLAQNRSTIAAIMRAISPLDGAFSSRDMVGCEHSASPVSGARPTAILKMGSSRRASQSSASAQPAAMANILSLSISTTVWSIRAASRRSVRHPASRSARRKPRST